MVSSGIYPFLEIVGNENQNFLHDIGVRENLDLHCRFLHSCLKATKKILLKFGLRQR